MATFIGDFVCKADAKGRIVLPSLFKKVMNTMEENRFVVRKDLYGNCLLVYPYPDWETHMEEVRSKVNMFNREENKFYRQYIRAAAEITFDANGRMLMPKRLMEKIKLPKEVVMVGVDDKIEIWSKVEFEGGEMSDDELANMMEGILGRSSNAELKEGE
ncbi:division/cell wall cluster transcriptional repressor MraZ [Labilibacter marinus]|uniref:division/cell wall cluster transcriptional repressor MraZ n=1 Tax=Labilibacter marinus TaxID=1477105 RepID=UPI00082AE18D|nr:division/cell wall cluster transcriptional repressor MraZ [Labilibacter marinus]